MVNGLVQGNVRCSKHIELASKAIVAGDIDYNMIEMVLGSVVNGKLVKITAEEGEAPRLSESTKPVEHLDLADDEGGAPRLSESTEPVEQPDLADSEQS